MPTPITAGVIFDQPEAAFSEAPSASEAVDLNVAPKPLSTPSIFAKIAVA